MSASRFINPHRLFHGVWLPQCLEERPGGFREGQEAIRLSHLFRGWEGLFLAVIRAFGGKNCFAPAVT